MSAAQAIENSTHHSDVLKAPYNAWSMHDILAHFKVRKNVAYFAVPNAPEITRDKIDALLTNRFMFNEEVYTLPELDWLTNPSTDIEWSIMLHKFYYAVGLGIAYKDTGDKRYAEKWIELTSSWMATVPVDFLSTDVTGRRIQNWIFAHYYFVTECQSDYITPEFYYQFLASLQQQVSYLCQNLTPARNHRTLELYAVFLAAVVFPELADADYWLQFSIDELCKNIQSDILDDGVHCELSTDYHHIVLRNFLAVKCLAVMNHIDLPKPIDDGIKKALDFALHLHKPDGSIPSLSDGDTGSFLVLLQQGYELYGNKEMRYVATQGKQGQPPATRSKAFPLGGYYILRSGWGEAREAYEDERYLVFDCGDLGAGNHGHLDVLNIEMAAYGQSLIVDPGRYTYDESGDINWRVLFRGTSYHNTVLVDGNNQTRYEPHTHKFKIKGAAPKHELKDFLTQPGFDYLHGIAYSHEYPVIHERKILFIKGKYWVICDVLKAREQHNYNLLFHLAVSADNKVMVNPDPDCITVMAPHLLMMQPILGSTTVSVENGFVSPTYGVKHSAPVIKFNQQGSDCCFYTVLYPYKNKRPELTLTTLPVTQNGKPCAAYAAACLSLTINTGQQVTNDIIFIANAPGEYETDDETISAPIFCKSEDKNTQLLTRYDCSSLNRNNLGIQRQGE